MARTMHRAKRAGPPAMMPALARRPSPVVILPKAVIGPLLALALVLDKPPTWRAGDAPPKTARREA